MRIIRAKDYKDMSRKAANIISAQVILKPDSVLGLATGSSPIGTYEQLVKWYEKGDLDFADVTTVNLDEYYGMKPENDQSYHYFMHDHFFDHVNIDPSRINLPNGMEPDEKKECARYDAVLRSVGDVDIQLLGIGRNGHIGFNEPDNCFAKGTHCVELTESTIEANKRFFASEDEVPRRAYSMGIHTIMTAKKVLVVASGEDKAWEYLQKLDQNVGLYTRSGVEPAERVKNGEYAVGIVFSHDAFRAALDGYPIEVRSPADGTGYEIGACALVRNAPAGERENACTFLDWMTSARGQECYIEAKSCRLPANSTARAADGLPSLDELNLISYDAEWAGENRSRLVRYFTENIINQY